MLEGFTRTEIKTTRRAHRHRARRQRAAAAADARQSVHASVVAQVRAAAGAGLHRGRDRSARLRRFREAAGRRGSQRLFVPRHGAGPGRGDGGARLRRASMRPATTAARACSTACASIIRRRSRAPRSSTSSRSIICSTTRHAAWATGAYHWFFMIQPYDLPERLMSADPDFFIEQEARQDRAGAELLRQGGARRIQALLPQPGDRARHVRGLSRDLRRRSRDGQGGLRGRPQDHLPGAAACGARPARSAATTSPRRSGRTTRPTSATRKALPCGHYLSEEAPEETYAELRAFFAEGELR